MIRMLSVRYEGMAQMARNNLARQDRPRLLLAYSDSAHASRTVRYFRRLGWEVHMVASGAEAQRLAGELMPQVVVLDVNLPDETGWLSAAKIRIAPPDQRIVLLAEHVDPQDCQRAESLGVAGIVCRADGPEALASLAIDQPLSVAV
jgi:CheY-like chemotaxis protein